MYGHIAGWGGDEYSTDAHYTEELNSVSLPILDKEKCTDIFKGKELDLDDNRRFCAGGLDGVDACWVSNKNSDTSYSYNIHFFKSLFG